MHVFKCKISPQSLPSIPTRLKSSSLHDSYQFLQKSKIPSFHFQPSLPRLPIPKLENSCQKYLAALQPLLSETTYKNTESVVEIFKTKVGIPLQEQLVNNDAANKQTSYISKSWFDMYLQDRKSLPINYNPFLTLNHDARKEYNEQSIRATNLLISSLRFYKSLSANLLEPEVFHMNPKKSDTKRFRTICSRVPAKLSWYAAYMQNVYPLDMSQYNNLFNTTRIPNVDKDVIFSKFSKHILVQYKGHFYMFDVLDDAGNIIAAQDIFAGVKKILSQDVAYAEFPLGLLTTLERNKWAKVRKQLLSLGNEKVFDLIDSALFNICLDDEVIGEDKKKMVRNGLHSDGSNRWFDKSLSLLITKDGYATVNFEHSWGDGVAVLRFFEEILKDSTAHPQIHPDTKVTGNVEVRKLDINLDDRSKSEIADAAKEYKKNCDSLAVNFIVSEGIGKDFCKKHSLSPDAMMQLCFQSAYHKQFGKFVATYESASTSAFKHGRTETVRPCTNDTKNFCLAVNSKHNKPSTNVLIELIKACSKTHTQLVKDAAMGQGFDRHLFALRLLAAGKQLNEGNIFEDEAYKIINHNVLSTSTLASTLVQAGGFGPVVADGIGLGYYIQDKAMGILAITYDGVDGAEFIRCTDHSVKELIQILSASKA